MRLSTAFLNFSAMAFAAALASFAAALAADLIEDGSTQAVRTALAESELGWSEVEADGLLLTISGEAATEAERFRVLTAAATVVEPTRLIDNMTVKPTQSIAAPQFTVEILRNDDGISLIGLIPADFDRAQLVAQAGEIAGPDAVADLLEVADYPMPEVFPRAIEFSISALRELPRAKISASSERVAITALAASTSQRARLQTQLARQASDDFVLALDISAPRPVITPFTLRFVIDRTGARFDACAADTERGRDRIVQAAIAAGLDGAADCTIGLGVPSPRWTDASVAAIEAVAKLGRGNVTISDADVTLVAPATVARDTFDRAAGELETALPEVFSLSSLRQEDTSSRAPDDGPPEFIARLTEDGRVELRGRVTNELMREAAGGYAEARFGVGNVYIATVPDTALPTGWPTRVLAGLQALSELSSGRLVVRPDLVSVSGLTGNADARATIAGLLSEKLGSENDFELDVTYSEALDPIAQLPTPQDCVDRVNAVFAEQKITFAPGSATIDEGAFPIIDEIADALVDCEEVPMEIGGHTDSQGRESMNQSLSQTRAEAVIDALLARRVRTNNLVARGYGENDPIGDNNTEDGRELNRRIEFKLLAPEVDTTEATETETPDEQN